jgi:hypothetical protein
VLTIAVAAAFIRLFRITEDIDQFSYLRTMPVNATTGMLHGSSTIRVGFSQRAIISTSFPIAEA